jgi:hypothetical protein
MFPRDLATERWPLSHTRYILCGARDVFKTSADQLSQLDDMKLEFVLKVVWKMRSDLTHEEF